MIECKIILNILNWLIALFASIFYGHYISLPKIKYSKTNQKSDIYKRYEFLHNDKISFFRNWSWFWICILALYTIQLFQFGFEKEFKRDKLKEPIVFYSKLQKDLLNKKSISKNFINKYFDKSLNIQNVTFSCRNDSIFFYEDTIKNCKIESKKDVSNQFFNVDSNFIIDIKKTVTSLIKSDSITEILKKPKENQFLNFVCLKSLKKIISENSKELKHRKIDSLTKYHIPNDKTDFLRCSSTIQRLVANRIAKNDTIYINKLKFGWYYEDLSNGIFNWLKNTANTLSALFLFLCFLSLIFVSQEEDNNKHVERNETYKRGIVYAVILLIFIDALIQLLNFKTVSDFDNLQNFFSYLSGIINAFAIFLFAGKLDSKLLKLEDYKLGRFQVSLIYLYGAIQPLYFVFNSSSNSEIYTTPLLFIALFLKASFFYLVFRLVENSKMVDFIEALKEVYKRQKEEFRNLRNLRYELIIKKNNNIQCVQIKKNWEQCNEEAINEDGFCEQHEKIK